MLSGSKGHLTSRHRLLSAGIMQDNPDVIKIMRILLEYFSIVLRSDCCAGLVSLSASWITITARLEYINMPFIANPPLSI